MKTTQFMEDQQNLHHVPSTGTFAGSINNNWRRLKRGLIFCISFLLLFPLNAQSLLEDTEDMVQALEQLQKMSPDSATFQRTQATAQILAILDSYDQSVLGDSIFSGSWSELLSNYSGNALIENQLKENGFSISDSMPATIYPLYYNDAQKRLSGPRQKILNLLQAEEAISPADYLSVSNTLEKYSLPPIKNTTSTALAAQASNTNVSNGLVNASAVIQGLFEFVLDRAKDEVVINFLDRMLNEDSPEFKLLFPTVISQFSNLEFTYSNSFIERLRQAFYEDIQKLSIRLPLLMLEDDYFKALQSEPIAYSFLTLYSMVGMAQNDIPVEEIMPITHRFLYKSYEESIKEVNFELAEKAYDKPEYSELINLSDTVVDRIKSAYLELDQAQAGLIDTVKINAKKFPDSTVTTPSANVYLRRGAYDLEVLLGSDNSSDFDLSILPLLLQGGLDSATVVGYNTLTSYDNFFSVERTPEQWRAAGLEIAHNLNGTWYQDRTIADIFYSWQKDLSDYKKEIDQWKNTIDPAGALQRALAAVENERASLFKTINESKAFWQEYSTLDQHLAFILLAGIVDNFDDIDDDPAYDLMEDDEAVLAKLERKKKRLLEVEERLIALNNTLKEEHPTELRSSPLQMYLINKQGITPYAYLIAQIDDLATDLKKVDQQLKLLENNYSPLESKARNNARPILQTTDFATQLMYGLRTGNEDQKWLTKVQLDTLLDGGMRQDVFLGLLTQRLSKVKEIGLFSPAGIAQLIQLTVTDLKTLPVYTEMDTLVQKDSLSFYHKAAFVVNTLNRMLELPLVADRNNPRTFTPLKDQIPGMSQVPDISDQTLDFIYYVNVKDHRHAVSSLLRLFSYLDADIDAEKDQDNKRKSAIQYLQKYGDFIADLVDAEDGEQVKDLLENIADPPGSSRLKRTQQLTVGLNAYLGGTVGWEKWSGNALTAADEGAFSLAPSMPVGIAISTLIGKKKNSFSLFLSFLDLGSLLSYRADSDILGSSVFTFKNVFKPGVQLQWNIKKSPFYLAVGGQYGPQIRTLNGEDVTLGAVRYFTGFGVDVPIKTLFQK